MSVHAELSLTVFKKVTELLGKLTDEQLAALADGTGELAFVSGQTTITSAAAHAAKPAPPDVVARLPELSTQAEAEQYLRDMKLTIAQMRAVAAELRITVPAKPKNSVLAALAHGAVGFKAKHQAVMGGPYQR